MRLFLISAVCALVVPEAAQAYVGPGLGAGTIVAVFGMIGVVFLVVFAAVYYPIKRELRKSRREKSAVETADTSAMPADEAKAGGLR